MSRELSLGSPSSARDAIYKLWRKFTSAFTSAARQTGQFWIDGKPIYRKVITFGALPNATTKGVAHGITGYDLIVGLSGVAQSTSVVQSITLPDVFYSASLILTATDISISTPLDLSPWERTFVVVEYTLL